MRRSFLALAALLALGVPTLSETSLRAAGVDPVARGLDVLVHASPAAVAGAILPVDVRAYGFVRVTSAAPLPKATVRAAWNPESLGPNVTGTLPDVVATTGADGTAHLDVPVPAGSPRALELLISVESGEHSRVRTLEVKRTDAEVVELRVPDHHVVPGSELPSWVTVRSSRTDAPIPGAPLEVVLLEGDVPRATASGFTDASGIFRTKLAVPAAVIDSHRLSLRARRSVPDGAESSVQLSLREEVPGTPSLIVRWQESSLRPGAVGHATIRVDDASGERLVGQPVHYWAGPRGTKPPATDAEWAKVGKAASTDGTGELALALTAPRVITSAGTDLSLVVRSEVDGQVLAQTATLIVSPPTASADARVEGGALVPGLAQRLFLTITDEESSGPGDYDVTGDGLRARVTTDQHGDTELTWNVPANVGGSRQVGPCAGGVAATMVVRRVREQAAKPGRKTPFELCVPVDRDRTALLRTDVQIATIGDKLHARVDGADTAKKLKKGATSFLVTGPAGPVVSAWSDGTETDLDLSAASPGLHTITAVTPQPGAASSTVAAQFLVRPRVLPQVTAKVREGTGPLAPGTEVTFDVALDDGHGHPLTGTVAAVLIDREGGGTTRGFEALDARVSLCDAAGIPGDRCRAALDGETSADRVRRAVLTTRAAPAAAADSDPEASAPAALQKTFSGVLHSLEGAVFEATNSPDALRDVRRREAGRWVINPELMTLVTAAMSPQPETPGGEPFALGDLQAVDRQVTFDNVARRVTRLKLFRVLSAIRTFKHAEQVAPDEPLMRDPAALLRRLVRDNTIQQEALLDPWGGTLGFVHSNAPPTPFLAVAPGWELRSPGPDGVLGNGDDIRDPFERVVKSGTAYATSMGEDEIVDAKWDMRVSDPTVDNWTRLFDRLTGTALGGGRGEGIGLGGVGSGGGGMGSGHGGLGGSSRQGASVVTSAIAYVPPVATDASGHATLRMRLGDAETTWRAAIVARTADGKTAVSTVDISSLLPFSVRVDLGRRLVIGDAIGGRVLLRNRLNTAQRATVKLDGSGALALASGQPRTLIVDVPAKSSRSFFARIDAKSVGTGTVSARAETPGAPVDATRQDIEVYAAAEARILMTSVLARGDTSLSITAPEHYVFEGSPKLVVESGFRAAFEAALDATEPRGNSAPDALADAIEIATRIRKVAEATRDSVLAQRARERVDLAQLYLDEAASSEAPRTRLALARARTFSLAPPKATVTKPDRKKRAGATSAAPAEGCPTDADVDALGAIAMLEAEPPPSATGPLACSTSLLSKVRPKTALEAARVIAALVERPHRAALVGAYARDLARSTGADGPSLAVEGPRAEQAIVAAALLRSASSWSADPAAATSALVAHLTSLRDGLGGYGSSEATRNAVRAWVALPTATDARSKVRVEYGATVQNLDVAPRSAQRLVLGGYEGSVKLQVDGGAVVARLERFARRPWLGPPDTTPSPIEVTVVWPDAPRAGTNDSVYVKYKNATGHPVELETRVTLPAGATLAARADGVSLRQGFISIRTTVATEETVALPIRFALPGRVLAPETETFVRSEDEARALSPAQRIVVR